MDCPVMARYRQEHVKNNTVNKYRTNMIGLVYKHGVLLITTLDM
jgi:membrane carboxypeptidase/penicillin-binding protein